MGAGGREGNNWVARAPYFVLFCFITCGFRSFFKVFGEGVTCF